MNLNDPRHPWTRLTAAARRAPEDRDPSAPFGFATRIAALALAQEPRILPLFERFALRAVGVSCLLALASVCLNYSALTATPVPHASVAVDEEVMPTDDALAAVLDFSD